MKPLNLQLGWPSANLLPRDALKVAAEKAFEHNALGDEALLYGPDPGSEALRGAVAQWLTNFYRSSAKSVNADRIFIGNGASASLGVILGKFTDPLQTQYIWMVEPTYFLACPIFEDAGFGGRLRGVPEDDDGIDLEFLGRALAQAEEDPLTLSDTQSLNLKSREKYPKIYRHVVYVVPTWSNPSGKVMSLRKRQELVALARRYDALIVADDVYDMVRWPVNESDTYEDLPQPPPRLADVDRDMPGQTIYGNTCSNGSFSKIIAPGTRVSWIEATPTFAYLLSTHGATRSGGSPSQMASIIVYHLLESGMLETHLRSEVLPVYRQRCATMMNAIKEHLEPLGVKITGGVPMTWQPGDQETAPRGHAKPQAGGFFAYIMFPADLPPAKEITDIALNSYALKLPPGQIMTAAGDNGSTERCAKTFGRGARLSWSWLDEDDIREGIQRLALVIQDIRAGSTIVSFNTVCQALEAR